MILASVVNPQQESGTGELRRRKRPARSGVGTEGKPRRAVGFPAFLIVSLVLLILSMILPLVLVLGMKLDFHAGLESVDWSEQGVNSILSGADKEDFTRTIATDYSVSFVPARLTEEGVAFNVIGVFYGPLMLTGSPLELEASSTAEKGDLTGFAKLRFRSFWVPVVFTVLYLLILLIADMIVRNPGALIKLVVTISVLWLVYALVMWALGEWSMRTFERVLNKLLSEEQGAASFSLGFMSVFAAFVKVFLWGMVYSVLSLLLRRAKSEPVGDEFEHAKQLGA